MRLVLPALLSLCATAALAAGSVELSDIRALLHRQPSFEVLLTEAFDIEPNGSAARLGHHFKQLAGSRIGPYAFKAKPRGQAGPDTLDVTICTEATFLGQDGRPTREIFTAARVTETITSVIIRQATAKGYANCGDELVVPPD